MRMSHIYQPVMLMELLSNRGNASVEEIAKQILVRDPSQVKYYSHITKQMPGRVLGENHNLVTKENEQYSLNGFSELSNEEIEQLMKLCESKLDDFIEKEGKRIWQHRIKSSGYVSDSIRYKVFSRAKHRCELCGILEKDKALGLLPINKQSHLRPLSTINQVNKSLSILKGKPKIKRTMWSRRAQEYDQKINSGKIYELAEVVRDLNKGNDTLVDQSYSERQLFEKAYERMLSEFKIVLNITIEDTQKKLDKALNRISPQPTI